MASGAASSSPGKRASARCCSLMSRETEAMPTIRPSVSLIGDIVTETVTVEPSACSRSVWYCSTRSPAAILARTAASGALCPTG